MSGPTLRKRLEPALRRLFHLYWRVARGMTLGVRGVVLDQDNKVFLIKHSYVSGWHLPGGGVERGEAPTAAILRELTEEIGLVRSDAPLLRDVFSRRLGIVTNVVALYRVSNVELDFKPNYEIREICHADPANPPPDTVAGTRRRLAEFAGQAMPDGRW